MSNWELDEFELGFVVLEEETGFDEPFPNDDELTGLLVDELDTGIAETLLELPCAFTLSILLLFRLDILSFFLYLSDKK